jgi:hypothetical protein
MGTGVGAKQASAHSSGFLLKPNLKKKEIDQLVIIKMKRVYKKYILLSWIL